MHAAADGIVKFRIWAASN